MPSIKRYIVVPCGTDEEGKIKPAKLSPPPYGYHHIYKVYEDGSFWLDATVNHKIDEIRLMEIAKIIAGEIPIEIDHYFFLEEHLSR